MSELYLTVEPVSIALPPGAHRGRFEKNVAVTKLLSALGLREFQTERAFVGSVSIPQSLNFTHESTYVTQYSRPLYEMARYAGLREISDAQVQVSWSGTDLTIEFTQGVRLVARFDLAPLGSGQEALAGALRRRAPYSDQPPVVQAADVTDCIAGIAANVAMRGDESDDDYDPYDPTGLLAFAEDLERAGVASWPAHDQDVLANLARGWTGSSTDLLTIAKCTGIGP